MNLRNCQRWRDNYDWFLIHNKSIHALVRMIENLLVSIMNRKHFRVKVCASILNINIVIITFSQASHIILWVWNDLPLFINKIFVFVGIHNDTCCLFYPLPRRPLSRYFIDEWNITHSFCLRCPICWEIFEIFFILWLQGYKMIFLFLLVFHNVINFKF